MLCMPGKELMVKVLARNMCFFPTMTFILFDSKEWHSPIPLMWNRGNPPAVMLVSLQCFQNGVVHGLFWQWFCWVFWLAGKAGSCDVWGVWGQSLHSLTPSPSVRDFTLVRHGLSLEDPGWTLGLAMLLCKDGVS